ncbi:hypothetical protein SAMN04488518_1324 [Pseudovibrio ascidiaceicola]|uniref:Uncharacterized protein n=1 Tax=Pseudovibrio ascidiaceicola TaxID=285279 RepID=A0A1I4G6W0_9HYPH|nr:hypothetical protein SAMN04488518_1324 [Pseudovibrio ascidiaceicola]
MPSRKGEGYRPHPVNTHVLDIFSDISRIENSAFVLPWWSDLAQYISPYLVEKAWVRVRERANLEDVRLYKFCHTVAQWQHNRVAMPS